jgi:hypothetical protein
VVELLMVMLVGLSEHDRPVVGAVVSVSETVPAKPSSSVAVMVAVPALFRMVVTEVGLAVS